MDNQYRTILKNTEVLHKDRGSKFIGFAHPVANLEMIKENLDTLKQLHSDATHVCYAYRLGIDGADFRANDDGEPNNSAGQPILREIKSLELTHLLVAVVRYYGGKKLGVSGLIDAYGTAAKLALELATITIETVQKLCWIKHRGAKDFQIYEYASRLGFEIIEQPAIPGSYFKIQLPLEAYDALCTSLESLPNFELTDKLNGD
jgi:putative IMPACT (imprinted ancient) family translation regulator